jgi:hypothetical protein
MVALLGYRIVSDLFYSLQSSYYYYDRTGMTVVGMVSEILRDVVPICKESFLGFIYITVPELEFIPLSVAIGIVFMILSFSIYHIYGSRLTNR